MERRSFLRETLASGVSLLFAPAVLGKAVSGQSKKPNIIFFFVDDMGWQDTAEPFHTSRTALNDRYCTPHMERLAADGMKFTQAYACALCSPSRISLMTGLNAARHRVTNWTLRKDKSPDKSHATVEPPKWNLNGLSQEAGVSRTYVATTLPALLGKEGYWTIHAGKAHFAADGIPSEDPCKLGFDVNIAGHCAGGPGSYYGKNNFSAAWRNADRIWDVPGLEKYHGKDIYLTEALTLEATEAVSQAVKGDKPFYLYMSHYAVHAPWEADPRFIDKYRKQGFKGRYDAIYASMIEGMDKSLGDIMTHVKKLGIEDNTIVVFMTDNGCPSQLPRNLPLRGHKIRPYEGGVRVPLIVKWPGVVKPKTVCNDDYVIIEDIFPTFLEMAGCRAFKQADGAMDGISFVPLLKGKSGLSKDRPIFWHFPHTYGQTPYSSVRKNDWKLIYHHAQKKIELFNLADDISETQDLSKTKPRKVEVLAKILSDFLRQSGALMPIDKRTKKAFPYPDQVITAGHVR
ncbi:MAG: sulfatase [Phycisphaerae bacterium]|nr:sulfatase [Phycisphaerae bacterium]